MTTLNLTADELAIIEAKRAQEEAARLEREAKQAAIAERQRKAHEQHLAQVQTLADAILAADTDNLITVTADNKLTFNIGDVSWNIQIEEHHPSTGNRWSYSTTRKGYKYLLSGSFNDYKRQYYKNPKSVIKKIVEMTEIHQQKVSSKQYKAKLSDRALAFAKKTYPNAKIELEPGYDYRNGRQRQTRNSYRPDTINVSTDRGSYEFSYGERDGKIVLGVWKRNIRQSLDEEIRKLILG